MTLISLREESIACCGRQVLWMIVMRFDWVDVTEGMELFGLGQVTGPDLNKVRSQQAKRISSITSTNAVQYSNYQICKRTLREFGTLVPSLALSRNVHSSKYCRVAVAFTCYRPTK